MSNYESGATRGWHTAALKLRHWAGTGVRGTSAPSWREICPSRRQWHFYHRHHRALPTPSATSAITAPTACSLDRSNPRTAATAPTGRHERSGRPGGGGRAGSSPESLICPLQPFRAGSWGGPVPGISDMLLVSSTASPPVPALWRWLPGETGARCHVHSHTQRRERHGGGRGHSGGHGGGGRAAARPVYLGSSSTHSAGSSRGSYQQQMQQQHQHTRRRRMRRRLPRRRQRTASSWSGSARRKASRRRRRGSTRWRAWRSCRRLCIEGARGCRRPLSEKQPDGPSAALLSLGMRMLPFFSVLGSSALSSKRRVGA